MTQPSIGLLPLYLELYDRGIPEVRPRMEAFYAAVAQAFTERGIRVETTPLCRLKPEFMQAVSAFEGANVDCIVTLHLAYSPSLESAEVLTGTTLPVVVLDTTPTYDYSPQQDPAELMYNHGIHGVQDLCNLLLRLGKAFHIEAGHWEHSDVLDRVAAWARAAQMATAMRTARVGRIGDSFHGMGDFAIPPEILRTTIGMETVPADPAVIRALLPADEDPEVAAEMNADLDRFEAAEIDIVAHRRSVRAGLAVRRWLEQERLNAFSFNFLAVDQSSGIPTVPFLEASKAMARGIGYAGEGDVLTAALVGALASVYPDTSFIEMFCPDWAGERIFLNHMGEMNIALAAEKPRLLEMTYPWSDAENPAFAVGRFRCGEAVLVNLAPGPQQTYTLIIAPVSMVHVEGENRMAGMVNGWFKPPMPIADFLTAYSNAGGTHHSALVYGNVADEMVRFGQLMEWSVKEIK